MYKSSKTKVTTIILLLVFIIICNKFQSQAYAEENEYDFTMTHIPWPIPTTAGQSISWIFWVNSTSTTQKQVTLSCFVPSPASCNISQPSVFPDQVVTLTVRTSINSQSQYQVIVTGTSGIVSHSSTFTIHVNSYLPIPNTIPPFVPDVPIALSPESNDFVVSMAIRPSYNQGDKLDEYIIFQNISTKLIFANEISGIVSAYTNSTKIFSDNFQILYDIPPGLSIGETGAGISWTKGSWTIPSSMKPGWYEMKIYLISKDTRQVYNGQIFFKLLNKTLTNTLDAVRAIPSSTISNSHSIGTVSINMNEFILVPHMDTNIMIYGNIVNYSQQFPVGISLESPSGVKEDLRVYGTNKGDFQLFYMLPSNSLPGAYTVKVKYNELEIGSSTFDVILESQKTGQDKIPVWIKKTIQWWSTGSIDDSEFIQSMQFLVKHNVIRVPLIQSTNGSPEQIPPWVKNNASWWSHNQISDTRFIGTIEYLISVGIIKL